MDRYQWRAKIAGEMDLHFAGEITGTDVGRTYVEDSNLRRFTKNKQLVRGTLWTYKPQSPSGYKDVQWRNITAFLPYEDGVSDAQITLEYPLDLPNDETTVVGDAYEVFLALDPDMWDKALVDAIRAAWPMIFETRRYNPTGVSVVSPYDYDLPSEIDQVAKVAISDQVRFPTHGERTIPRSRYELDEGQSVGRILRFLSPLPSTVRMQDISVYAAGRYPTDRPQDPVNLDDEFLVHQSKANAHTMLANATQRQAAHGDHATLAQWHQNEAYRRKQEVASMLAGQEMEAPKQE